jgi:putative ABC transport system permease protein
VRPVWLWTRSELGSAWRAWLVLALLFGLAGGAAIASVAGARRTESAYPRFVAWSRAADVLTGGFPGKIDPETALRTIEHLPSVAAWARVDVVSYAAVLPSGLVLRVPDLIGVADSRGSAFVRIDRVRVLSGRMLDPSAADEAVVDFATAERYGLHVDSVLRVAPAHGNPFVKHLATTPVRIVGVVAAPSAFPAFGAANTLAPLLLSPAFQAAHHVHPYAGDSSLLLRLRGGRSALMRDMNRAGLGDVDVPFVQATRTAGVQKSARLEAAALWIMAAVIVLAAAAILGQVLARQTSRSSIDFATLRAVGMTGRQLFSVGLIRAALIGGIAAVVAVLVALALSPLTPIGLARLAEPHPGFAVDVPVLVIGAGCIVALIALLAVIPAMRAARLAASPVAAPTERASGLARVTSRIIGSPAASTGVRMALEPGRGRTAVPVRSAIVGTTLAITALMASLLFWSSLDHLLNTPRLSGFAWDVFAAPPEGKNGPDRVQTVLDADRDVAGYTRGGFVNLFVAGRSVFGVVTGGGGPASPVLVAGRAPRTAQEIALGSASLAEAKVGMGDTLRVGIDVAPAGSPMHVVGEVIVPPSPFGETRPGEGAVLTYAGAARLSGNRVGRGVGELPFLVRFRDGVDPEFALERLRARLPAETFLIPSQRRGDIVTLGRIARVPLALAVILGVIALGTMTQTLATSIRARRRDLAILKTIGFSRGQVGATVAWQATTLVAIALGVGIPVGIAAGRWAWRSFADGIAVIPAPVIDPLWVLLAVPVTILLANAIAVLPGRSAARTRPAIVLRAE